MSTASASQEEPRATAGAARRSWPVLEDPPEPSHRVTTVTAPPPQSCLCGAPGLGRSGTADARGTTLALALSGGLALAFSRRRRR